MAIMTRQQAIQDFNSKISEDYNILYTLNLKSTDDYGQEDYDLINKIKNNLKERSKQTELLKTLTPEVGANLDYLVRTLNNMSILFTYSPADSQSKVARQNQTSEKRYSYKTGNTVIGLHPYVEGGKALGETKRTLGLIDDVTNYNGKPTMEITKQSAKSNVGNNLHEKTDVGGGYSVSFNFKLNRFPSKTYQDNSQNWFMKQYTTRRTDLITFEYEPNTNCSNTIEFGAMAPYDSSYSRKGDSRDLPDHHLPIARKEWYGELDDEGFPTILSRAIDGIEAPIELNPGQNAESTKLSKFKFQKANRNDEMFKYNNKYNKQWGPFSIAACFTINKNRKISLFTDYKFELGVWYTVTLDILPYKDATIYESFVAGITVNGVREEVMLYNGKVWGKEAKNFKNAEQIPTKPNFESASYGSTDSDGQKRLDNVGQTFKDEVGTSITRDDVMKNLQKMSRLTGGDYSGKGNFKTNFSTLKSIYSCPSYINIQNNGKNNNTQFYDKIYKNYTYKTNSGVDFGTITIYSEVSTDEAKKKAEKEAQAKKQSS